MIKTPSLFPFPLSSFSNPFAHVLFPIAIRPPHSRLNFSLLQYCISTSFPRGCLDVLLASFLCPEASSFRSGRGLIPRSKPLRVHHPSLPERLYHEPVSFRIDTSPLQFRFAITILVISWRFFSPFSFVRLTRPVSSDFWSHIEARKFPEKAGSFMLVQLFFSLPPRENELVASYPPPALVRYKDSLLEEPSLFLPAWRRKFFAFHARVRLSFVLWYRPLYLFSNFIRL